MGLTKGQAHFQRDIPSRRVMEPISTPMVPSPPLFSSTLRTARLLIAKRGWGPRTASQHRTGGRGPVDVVTAIRVAFGGYPNAPLELMDYYALLAPIASVLGRSFATWERQHDVDS